MQQPNKARFFQTMKLYMEDEEDHNHLRRELKRCFAKARQGPDTLDLARELVAFLDFAATCPRASCLRKGVCTSPHVVCRFERRLECEDYELAPVETPIPPPAMSWSADRAD